MIVPILIVQIATEKVERLFRQKLSLFALIVVATNVLRSLKSGFQMITPVTEPFFQIAAVSLSMLSYASQTRLKLVLNTRNSAFDCQRKLFEGFYH